MEKLLLSEIAGALHSTAPFEKEITDISTDTRNLKDGCLFVAIKGCLLYTSDAADEL